MRKRTKIILGVIFTIVLLTTAFWAIDHNRVQNNLNPFFIFKTSTFYDGGSKEFYGLGYKVIKCMTLSGDKSVHFKFYNTKVNKVCKNNPIDVNDTDEYFEEFDDANREHIINQNINLKKEAVEKQKELIGNIIKEKINNDFVFEDYVIEISEPMVNDKISNTIYDFNFTIAGVKTDIGYTVFSNGNRTIVKTIYDNTLGHSTKKLKDENEEKISLKLSKITEKQKEEIKSRAFKHFEIENYTLKIVDEKFYFKVKKKELVYMISVEGTNNDTGAMFANTYEELI